MSTFLIALALFFVHSSPMTACLAAGAYAKKKRLFRPARYRAGQNRRREHANFGGALECLPCAALIPVAQRVSSPDCVWRSPSAASTDFALHTLRCSENPQS